MLMAEVVLTICSLVTVKFVSKERKYRPQGGTLSFHFGGGLLNPGGSFGGLKPVQTLSDRPNATPGTNVIRRPQQPVKKDKDYPF